jgi:hypothetical protein
MTWAQRLKRVFGAEINTCARCGGLGPVCAGKGGSASAVTGRSAERVCAEPW